MYLSVELFVFVFALSYGLSPSLVIQWKTKNNLMLKQKQSFLQVKCLMLIMRMSLPTGETEHVSLVSASLVSQVQCNCIIIENWRCICSKHKLTNRFFAWFGLRLCWSKPIIYIFLCFLAESSFSPFIEYVFFYSVWSSWWKLLRKRWVLKHRLAFLFCFWNLHSYSLRLPMLLFPFLFISSSFLQIIRLNNERFTVPELLFHPSDIGIEEMGIPEAVAHVVDSLPNG